MNKICPNCNGTGEVVCCDGTVRYITYCIVCNGVGVTENDLNENNTKSMW